MYRVLVTQMKELKEVSEVRACEVLDVNRSSIRYQKKPEEPVNALIRGEMHSIAERHIWGLPRIVETIRKQYAVNHKRI